MKKKLAFFQSVLWIFCSAVIINSFAYFGLKGYYFWKKSLKKEESHFLRAIVQTGPQKEALKTIYLAEVLGLSANQPTSSAEFDLKEATKKLVSSPVIKEAEIKIKEPGILYVDYTTRQPVALLLDFENIALDEEKCPFPLAPFFTPKKLPEIYLGLEASIRWNTSIRNGKIDLAFELLELLNAPIVKDLFNVKRIDVSNAFHCSYGRKEIVLLTEDEIYSIHNGQEIRFVFPRILRLSTRKFNQELSDYLKLREQLLEKEKVYLEPPDTGQTLVICPEKIIDFRISQLAFIEEKVN